MQMSFIELKSIESAYVFTVVIVVIVIVIDGGGDDVVAAADNSIQKNLSKETNQMNYYCVADMICQSMYPWNSSSNNIIIHIMILRVWENLSKTTTCK